MWGVDVDVHWFVCRTKDAAQRSLSHSLDFNRFVQLNRSVRLVGVPRCYRLHRASLLCKFSRTVSYGQCAVYNWWHVDVSSVATYSAATQRIHFQCFLRKQYITWQWPGLILYFCESGIAFNRIIVALDSIHRLGGDLYNYRIWFSIAF